MNIREKRALRKQLAKPPKPTDIVDIEPEQPNYPVVIGVDKKVRDKFGLTEQDIIDIVDNPSPEGYLAMDIGDKTIDLRMLENYTLSQIPKQSLSTILRYNNALLIESMKGYQKNIWRAKKKMRY